MWDKKELLCKAERNTTGRADDLWLTASELAMDARDAALMTIDSALRNSCPEYREEHLASGYTDLEEDAPGGTLREHRCDRCSGLQAIALAASRTLGDLWRGGKMEITQHPEKLRRVKIMHSLLLGQVHMAAGLADEHVREWEE